MAKTMGICIVQPKDAGAPCPPLSSTTTTSNASTAGDVQARHFCKRPSLATGDVSSLPPAIPDSLSDLSTSTRRRLYGTSS
mmetsp:Transcript_27237/g.63480  ORF Transcript_27237/g.63480 Transcript_27237/m.63480 type:complete len:81 (-) Transcript_27237:14-256(-)